MKNKNEKKVALIKELSVSNEYDKFYIYNDDADKIISLRDRIILVLFEMDIEKIDGPLTLNMVEQIASSQLKADDRYQYLGEIKNKRVQIRLYDEDCTHLIQVFNQDIEVYSETDQSVHNIGIEDLDLDTSLCHTDEISGFNGIFELYHVSDYYELNTY